MAAVPLSPATETRLQLLFAPADQEHVRMALIEECGPNIPGNTMAGFERLRCAALKISGGDSAKLHAAIDLAKIDFRDMLMWANCANDVEAHLKWLPEQTW